VCLANSFLTSSGVDPARVGEICATLPAANYCGGTGRPGLCYDDQRGPAFATCRQRLAHGSSCPSGTVPGYVAYKRGLDQSQRWCYTPSP
jgi:hypothetical protein